ncbi:MAG: creatininase family protein [Rhodothermales bacterium]|nr:creatininase family protein [Rhodothermales bacterium]MBO6779348.1 creatininase family protein [Rhodothermales bacterium]
MTPRPYILAETTWADVRGTEFEAAILPWGATEAHNYHLPYSTDTIQCDHIAAEVAARAWAAGTKTIVLPTVPFGVQTGQLDIPLCLNMNPSTQFALLRDLARTLDGNGIPRLVVLNGHGGNSFKQMIRELQPEVETFLCAVDWYRVVPGEPYFVEPGDHAGEMETSLMMVAAPELVRPLSEAGSGAERRPVIDAMQKGWAWAPRPWTRISEDTGVGNPQHASAERGEAYLDAVCRDIAAFVTELCGTPRDKLYADRP